MSFAKNYLLGVGVKNWQAFFLSYLFVNDIEES